MALTASPISMRRTRTASGQRHETNPRTLRAPRLAAISVTARRCRLHRGASLGGDELGQPRRHVVKLLVYGGCQLGWRYVG